MCNIPMMYKPNHSIESLVKKEEHTKIVNKEYLYLY